MCKFFAHTTSLFSKVLDLNRSLTELNTDLEKTSPWAFQWKMQFNPDSNKQINKVILSRRLVSNNSSHRIVKINNSNNTRNSHQKHLGVILDSNLKFSTLILIKHLNKMISLIKQFLVNLPRKALITIYNSFIRPHLDYVGILYDKPSN